MTTWNKQTSAILARKPVAGKSSGKLQTTKLNCPDSFYLKGLVGSIGIMLLKFRLLRLPEIFLKPCPVKPKRGNLEVYIYICAWLSRCESFGIASVLQQLRATSTCLFYPLASLARLVSSSSFNHSSWLQCDPRSVRVKDLIRCSTCGFHQIFAFSASSKTKIGKKFSCVFVPT